MYIVYDCKWVEAMSLFRIDKTKRLALLLISTNVLYLAWLAMHVLGIVGWIFFGLEVAVAVVSFVFVVNHWTRRFVLLGGSYSLRSGVDVFIPTVDEPLYMLEAAMKAAAAIEYPRKTLFVLDDGGREAVKKLATEYGFMYLTRPDRAEKRYKAANLNFALSHASAPYVLVIDADNVVEPNILDDLLGHFNDKSVAIVSSRQSFTLHEDDFNHDYLFYNHMQTGKNANHAAISCGSGVIYRRKALDAIGGFSEWNLVEDLYTSYLLHSKGYKSVYVSQPYVLGYAPSDLSAIYKQRGTWALDTLRMMFWDSPLIKKGLSFRQRLHYFEIGYCYLVSAFFLTSIYIINFYTLFTNTVIHDGGIWYVVFRLPALCATLVFFGWLSRGQLTSRIWAGLFPVYMKAAVLALLVRKKPKYKVTPKLDHGRRELHLVLPQLLFLSVGYIALVFNYLVYGLNTIFAFSGFWTLLMSYWLAPIVLKALKLGRYKTQRTAPKPLAQPAA